MSATTAGVDPGALADLRTALRGTACLKGDDGYDDARTIWNAMVDRSPALAIRCAGAADVMRAVRFAGDRKLLLAIRGGGHNIAGNAVCEAGLQIDLSRMRSVRVYPERRTAWVEAGATLSDLDKETQAFGLALPVGINSTTGIAGLALGGGFGWLTRAFGMTIDNLLAAELVTARGEFLRADRDTHPDLFWALRGGGGNFGVVTAFEFQLHPVGPEVLSGLIVHPFDRAGELLREYRRIVAEAPDELTCWAVMRRAPPLPFLPAEWHGREVLVLALCYAGSMDQGEKAAAPLRRLGQPIADVVGPHSFVGWQSAFDPLLIPGARNYWKSHDLTTLPDEVIDTFIEAIRHLPGPECEIFIAQVGGAMSRVPADATAYPHRSAHFIMNVHARWREPSEDAGCIGWTRELFRAVAPFATGGAYVNFMPDDEADRIEKVYGTNYTRLAKIKRRWDPDNLFRMNQNIRPAA